MILEYGCQPYRSKTTTQMSLPFLPSPVRQTSESKGNQLQYILRPGLSYEYAKGSTIFLDYQLGIFNSDKDNLVIHRFNAGIEHRLLEWLFVRFSPSVDLQGNAGVSVGLSAFLAKWCSIEAAYQYNMLPEIENEFGRAQTLGDIKESEFIEEIRKEPGNARQLHRITALNVGFDVSSAEIFKNGNEFFHQQNILPAHINVPEKRNIRLHWITSSSETLRSAPNNILNSFLSISVSCETVNINFKFW